MADIPRLWPLGLYPSETYMHPLISGSAINTRTHAQMLHPALLPLSPSTLSLYYPNLPTVAEQTSPTDLSMSASAQRKAEESDDEEKGKMENIEVDVKDKDVTNSPTSKLKFGIEEILETGPSAGKGHHMKDEPERKDKMDTTPPPPLLSPLPPSLASLPHHKPYQFVSSRNGLLQIPMTAYPFAFHPQLRSRHYGCPSSRHNADMRGTGLNAMRGYTDLPSSDSQSNNHDSPKRKRSWSRAVFSALQRKGLEKRFEIQKYVTKPDRRQLAAMLGLTDAQVKVWFQNRRMKWRHVEEQKKKRMQQEERTTHRETITHVRDKVATSRETAGLKDTNTFLRENNGFARESMLETKSEFGDSNQMDSSHTETCQQTSNKCIKSTPHTP